MKRRPQAGQSTFLPLYSSGAEKLFLQKTQNVLSASLLLLGRLFRAFLRGGLLGGSIGRLRGGLLRGSLRGCGLRGRLRGGRVGVRLRDRRLRGRGLGRCRALPGRGGGSGGRLRQESIETFLRVGAGVREREPCRAPEVEVGLLHAGVDDLEHCRGSASAAPLERLAGR